MNKRVHVFIHGDVIGVGFRSWTLHNAKELQLTGWVRNADRDLVEAVFEGKEDGLRKMVEKCHKGPEVSWVEKVETEWSEATGEFELFGVRD